MKSKLIVVIVYLGLIVIDFSCRCPDALFEIVNIKRIDLFRIVTQKLSVPIDRDTISYDSLTFKVTFDEKLVMVSPSRFHFTNAVYATSCDENHTEWSLDSIRVFEIVNNVEKEVTSSFMVNSEQIDNRNQEFIRKLNFSIWSIPLEFKFALIHPPSKTESVHYKFQFFDTYPWRILEKTSQPIVIIGK